MKNKKGLIAIVLCVALVLSYTTYRIATKAPTPDITVMVYGQETEQTRRLKEEIGEGTVFDIQSMVTSSVAQNLSADGFVCEPGLAQTLENDNYTAAGLYYYESGTNMFASDSLQSVGFVQIVSETVEFEEPQTESSIIAITPAASAEEDELSYICTYCYENIQASHFIYQGKYVSYYQQSPMRVVYSILENETKNYDFTLGSLYDFDHLRYVYDESILDEYQTHSGTPLFSEADYVTLQTDLQEMAEQQYLNGYIVSEYRIVYISPESVQAYIDSTEEDTFYGYSTRELTEAFGYGTALVYTENGFQSAKMIEEEDSYNWKSFMIKVGVGCGILIVGAILAPVTGGTSFGCALITATKITVGASLCAGLGTLAVQTAAGLATGKSPEDALRDATHSGLDAFANTFLVMSVVASAGVASGAIKPSACFVAGTEVVTGGQEGNYTYAPIEDIKVGDTVVTWDSNTRDQRIETVEKVYEREVTELLRLGIDGTSITTTYDHPFMVASTLEWHRAGDLDIGDAVLLIDGSSGAITSKEILPPAEPVSVYNLEVSNTHTYYVGELGILVHNTCESTIEYWRRKAVDDAWARERNILKTDPSLSKYNWSPDEILEIINKGRASGYDGHHIVAVKDLIGTARESLIASADDIVFIKDTSHLFAHGGNFQNSTNLENLVELLPWVVERFPALGIAL